MSKAIKRIYITASGRFGTVSFYPFRNKIVSYLQKLRGKIMGEKYV
jgi:hypothetical protein